ncbi:MAG: winged helix-turn-helix transcriptional regulator [Rhodospirillales bacterium]|nr:winged helix-turn-helix transcriptional regulator [Rhodospirillales bacterium]
MDIVALEANINLTVSLLKALSNEKRLQILCALYKSEKTVGELEKIIGISQSALSQHLARLRKDGLVQTRRKAQSIYYSLNEGTMRFILEALYDIYRPEREAL